jgi:hypothetical protein
LIYTIQMKTIILYFFLLPLSNLYSQSLKKIENFRINFTSTKNKFNSRGTDDFRPDDGSSSNTKYSRELLLGAEIRIKKPLTVLFTAGVQAHKLQPAKILFASQSAINYSFRLGAGPVLSINNSTNHLIGCKLEGIFFVEGFIKKQSTFTSASDFFGNPLWQQLIYYDDYTPRFSIDINPMLMVNITKKIAFNIKPGYSIGLNESGSLATYFGPPYLGNSAPRNGININTAKENYFYFSCGLTIYPKGKETKKNLLQLFANLR